jgi:arylsulfatase A-like enzyme
MVGLLLATTETFGVVLTGRNISSSYLLMIAAFDLASGILAVGMAILIKRLAWPQKDDYAHRFAALAGGVLATYSADKVLMAAVFRGQPVAVGAAFLVAGLVLFLVVCPRLLRSFARTLYPDVSCLISLVLLIPFLVGGRHLARSILHARSNASSFELGFLTVLAFIAALFAQDRWLARGHARVAHWAYRLVVAVTAVGFAVALAIAHDGVAEVILPAASRTATPVTSRPNVILISVDTLRADRLSLYGYERDTTPFLRRLAGESVVFSRAVSPGTWTLPGHAAMLTGRFPGSLGALDLAGALPQGAVTLAERLSDAGYRTGAVVANASALDRRLGWGQGFGFYSDEPRRLLGYKPSLTTVLWSFPRPYARTSSPWKTAEQVNQTAFAWLAKEPKGPFFLFMNYMDTHDPYMPPDPWPDRYPGRQSFLVDPVAAVLRGQRDLTKVESLHFRAVYDGAVAYVDDQIGRLVERLAILERLDDTLLIVTSDHGEFLGEHRLFRHEIGPYEPVHRVPLLVRYPNRAHAGVEQGWVQLVDIMPTVLDVVGLTPHDGMDGDVLPRVRHPILIEQAPHPSSGGLNGRGLGRGYSGLYEGARKLVAFDDGSLLLFNLDDDPGETHDLAPREPQFTALMHARLVEVNARQARRYHPVPPDPELQERLRAGGYLR